MPHSACMTEQLLNLQGTATAIADARKESNCHLFPRKDRSQMRRLELFNPTDFLPSHNCGRGWSVVLHMHSALSKNILQTGEISFVTSLTWPEILGHSLRSYVVSPRNPSPTSDLPYTFALRTDKATR